jgi:hypothetical protein
MLMGGDSIPDIVFLIMGIIGLLILISIYFRLQRNPRGKRRPRGMSIEELGRQRSKYLHQAKHHQSRSQKKNLQT